MRRKIFKSKSPHRIMASVVLTKKIEELSRHCERLKANLAWYELKVAEHRLGDPPVLTREEELAQCLRDDQSRFKVLSTELHGSLYDLGAASKIQPKHEEFRHRLLDLEREFHGLAIPKDL